ncbi:MAG: hypothetical protein IPL79_17970 [Myxococcales bacterium]|nr:hypothetical protein [Myxococcales bacterium]
MKARPKALGGSYGEASAAAVGRPLIARVLRATGGKLRAGAASSLEAHSDLAYLLFVADQTAASISIVDVVAAAATFDGDFDLWSPIEVTLALGAVIDPKRAPAVTKQLLAPYGKHRAALDRRLKGELLEQALDDVPLDIEDCWPDLAELCFMYVLGGSKTQPPAKIMKAIALHKQLLAPALAPKK